MEVDPALWPRWWPLDRIHQIFFWWMLLVTAVFHASLTQPGMWAAVDVAVLVAGFGVVHFTPRMRESQAVLARVVHGTIAILLVFTQVGLTIHDLRHVELARTLAHIDRVMFFGHDPIEAVERVATPWLTELMQWCYTSYVVLPIVTVIVILRRATPRDAARAIFCLLGVMYFSYIGYWIFPASGPNLHSNLGPMLPTTQALLPDLFHFNDPLPGVWLAGPLREFMFRAEVTKQDCFPSGHVAVAVVCWVIARRTDRRLGWLCAPVSLGVVLSTVYLRYHYVVDVLAGIGIAALAVGPWMRVHAYWLRTGTREAAPPPASTR